VACSASALTSNVAILLPRHKRWVTKKSLAGAAARNLWSTVTDILGPIGVRSAARAAVALLLFPLCGCASLPLACLPPSRPMMSAELLFGRDIGNRLAVSEAAFAAFVAREITPRFPDGLTVIDARGQWRDLDRGSTVREASKLVKIVFADDQTKRADLDAIAAAYKTRFKQQAVLTSLQASCVTF
jgi:hypothetical protein